MRRAAWGRRRRRGDRCAPAHKGPGASPPSPGLTLPARSPAAPRLTAGSAAAQRGAEGRRLPRGPAGREPARRAARGRGCAGAAGASPRVRPGRPPTAAPTGRPRVKVPRERRSRSPHPLEHGRRGAAALRGPPPPPFAANFKRFLSQRRISSEAALDFLAREIFFLCLSERSYSLLFETLEVLISFLCSRL